MTDKLKIYLQRFSKLQAARIAKVMEYKAAYIEQRVQAGDRVVVDTKGYGLQAVGSSVYRQITKTEAKYAEYLGAPMPSEEEYDRVERTLLFREIEKFTPEIRYTTWKDFSAKYIADTERWKNTMSKRIYEEREKWCAKFARYNELRAKYNN